MRGHVMVMIAVLAAACGGRYPGAAGTTTPVAVGTTSLDAAALPMTVLDERTGHQLDAAELWTKLGAARAVCVGEEHPNPHHHWVQLAIVRQLVAHASGPLALGMEMFQRPFQGVLDDYATHKIDAAALRSRAGWEDRWGYDYALYGPTIDAAIAGHAVLLALNASKELAKKISHHGLESLTPDEKAQVPELKLDVAAHRAWFDALMEDMGGSEAHSTKPAEGSTDPHDAKPGSGSGSGSGSDDEAMPSADRIYTVQVLWDETMANTGAAWLTAHPGGKLIILAGTGHCHDSAIIGRLQRRGIKDAVSIRTVVDDGEGNVAEALAKPMNDFLIVLTPPPAPPGSKPAPGDTDTK